MQLTPTFKMSGLQLKPTSKVVPMRLAPSQDRQPPMNLQVTFEVAKIDLSGGPIDTIRLAPSVREKPAMLSSSSFAISGLEIASVNGLADLKATWWKDCGEMVAQRAKREAGFLPEATQRPGACED